MKILVDGQPYWEPHRYPGAPATTSPHGVVGAAYVIGVK